MMKSGWISVLSLAVAGTLMSAPSKAWQEPDEKPKPEEKKKQEPKPEDKPKPRPKEEKPKQEPTPPPKQQPQEKKQKETDKQDRRERTQESTERSAPSRPAQGKRIPEEKFRSSFGNGHHFRVARSGGDERHFQYGGFVFEVVEAWPVGWSFDDECYIEEDGDDYYVVDVVHPELRVIVIVVSG
jgi:hypothetical protein